MKLVATPDEIDKFSKLGILKVKSKNEYFIEVSDLKSVKHQIDVEMNTEPTNKPSNKVLEYDKYWEAFPTPSEIKKMLGGFVSYPRNLRTGSKDTIQKRLIKLSKSFTPQDIIDTIKFEVSMRSKESMNTGKDVFKFMKGAEPWANDEGNIITMFNEMKSSLKGGNKGSSLNLSAYDNDLNFV
jgi:hypothetical protein